MSKIGGNRTLLFQINAGVTKNAIGEQVPTWKDVQEITGWLDTTGGTSGYTAYNAKIQESTDVFIADYVPLEEGVKAETCRAVVDGKAYDVTYIDNPMNLNKQLEIFLKYTGGA